MLFLVGLLSEFVVSVPWDHSLARIESLSCGIGHEDNALRGIFPGLWS